MNEEAHLKKILDEQNKYKRTLKLESEDGGEKEVTITVLKGREGFTTGLKLINVIIPLTGKTLDGLKHDEYVHGAPSTFTELATLLCEQIDKIEIENLTFKLLDKMSVDGMQVSFDDYFAANYGELLEILAFSLKENFGSLFTQKGIKALLIQKAKKFWEGMSQSSTEL